MKKTIQKTIVGIFAFIGVLTIIMGFTEDNSTQQTSYYSVPESHVWEIITAFESSEVQRVYTLNKVTGELRKHSKLGMRKGKLEDQYYQVLAEDK